MSTITAYPAGIEIPTYRFREARIHWVVLLQIAVCVIPAMTAMGFGHLLLGARYLAISLFFALAYLFLKRDRYGYCSLVVGSLPALAFMREEFFYFSIIVFLGGGIFLWSAVAWEEVRFVWGDLTWRCLIFLSLLYWWSSIVYMHDYTANIRLLDYLFSSTVVYLLANRRSWLATSLIGIGLSSTALAISLLPYGDRLGAADIDSVHVGNPILMGVPSAMILLLALSDKGRLLMLEEHPLGRTFLALLAGEWLVLSGSRGSWAITAVCLTVLLLFSKLGRKALLAVVGVIALATVLVLLSNRGEKIQTIFEKTMDSNRTLKNRTSFRSVQWEAMPKVFAQSPIWGWGPGTGKNVAFQFTGRHLAWHALYLQVIGETGLVGFICLWWILGSLLYRAVRHLRRWGEITPLIGIVAYMTLGMSVSGLDAFSGIFLGLAFMARESSPRWVSREVRIGERPRRSIEVPPVA